MSADSGAPLEVAASENTDGEAMGSSSNDMMNSLETACQIDMEDSEILSTVSDVDDFASRIAAKKADLLQRTFTEERANLVLAHGWCQVDEFLPKEEALYLHNSALDIARSGDMFSPHKFQFAGKVFGKPNIYEIDLHDTAKREQVPSLRYIFHVLGPAIVQAAHSALPSLDLNPVAPSAIKLQLNAGGSFPCHYDNPGPPNKRRLTCLVYLNPEWKVGDGGEMELMPFLGSQINIPPLLNRLVVFRSDLVLHAVSPWKGPESRPPRLCFTVWIDSMTQGKFKLTRDHLRFSTWDEAEAFFKVSTLQRCISRAVYEEEYEQSLVRCVGGTSAERPMLLQHHAHVKALYASLRPLIEELRKRKEKLIAGI